MTDQLQELNNRRVNINDHIQKSFMNKHPKAMVVTEELFDEAFSKGLFVEYVDIYNDNLEKSYDKSKLQPRKVTDKNGHQRTVWVVRDNSLHSKEFNPNGVMQKRELTKEDIESVKGHEDKLSHINRVRFKKEYDKHFGGKAEEGDPTQQANPKVVTKPNKEDYNSNGVNKGYLSIWEKKEFDSKPYFEDRLSSVNKMSKLSEQEERYINSLNVVEIKGEQIKDINELFKKDDKLMDKPFVVKANSGKYLVDPQGYDYTRYISKLPTPHSKSNQENKFSITDDNIDKLLNIVSNGWDDETAIRNFKRYTGESTKDADVAREHFEEDVKERRLSPEAVEEYFGNSGIFD